MTMTQGQARQARNGLGSLRGLIADSVTEGCRDIGVIWHERMGSDLHNAAMCERRDDRQVEEIIILRPTGLMFPDLVIDRIVGAPPLTIVGGEQVINATLHASAQNGGQV